MKSKFLDLRNCHALLPKGNGLPLIARLDECPQGINNAPGGLNGSIDFLFKYNEDTIGKKVGTKRLCKSPIEISQVSDIETRPINTTAVERGFPGTAKYHTILGYRDGMLRKTIIPLEMTSGIHHSEVNSVYRFHGMERSDAEIVKEVGALNETQVKNVRTGKTYKRIV